MAKNGFSKFLSYLSMDDDYDDYDDDDLFDEDDDDEEEDDGRGKSGFSMSGLLKGKKSRDDDDDDYEDDDDEDYAPRQRGGSAARQTKQSAAPGKLVSINNRPSTRNNYSRGSEVYVIKPQDFNEAQTVTDYLREGKAIVINLEGIDYAVAQRVIDFIGGSCYAIDGSLQAISANIFIAAPSAVNVSGDLREEILGGSMVSPDLARY